MTKEINQKIKALLELDDLIEVVKSTDYGTNYKTKLEYLPRYNDGCCRHYDVSQLIAAEHKDKIITLKLHVRFYNGYLDVTVDQYKELLNLYADLEVIEPDDFEVYKEKLDAYLEEKLTTVSDKYKVQFSNNDTGWSTVAVDAKECDLFEGHYDDIYYSAERLGIISTYHGNYERAVQEIDIFLEPFIDC